MINMKHNNEFSRRYTQDVFHLYVLMVFRILIGISHHHPHWYQHRVQKLVSVMVMCCCVASTMRNLQQM